MSQLHVVVVASQLHVDVDVAVNMGMCIPKDALKEEANKDHQVLDNISHDVLYNYIN